MELDEVLSLLILQLKVTVEWNDPRLDYVDLKENHMKNQLTPQEVDKIWIPTLMFVNTKDKPETDFRSRSAHVSIRINDGKFNVSNDFPTYFQGYNLLFNLVMIRD